MRIFIGSDHAGYRRKTDLLSYLKRLGHRVTDVGTDGEESVDYPDYARAVTAGVRRTKGARGVLLCGTGIGMAIAANKARDVRAAVVWSERTARVAAEHNGANVLCLSGRLFRPPALRRMVKVWLGTPFGGGRHRRRVDKIAAIERTRR